MDSGQLQTVFLCFFLSRSFSFLSLSLPSILFLSLFYSVLKQQKQRQQTKKGREEGWPPASWQHWSECLYVCACKKENERRREKSVSFHHCCFLSFCSYANHGNKRMFAGCISSRSSVDKLRKTWWSLFFLLFLCCAMGTFCQVSHIFISSHIENDISPSSTG